MTRSDLLLSQLESDPAAAGVSPRERLLIDYAVLLTRDPAAVTADHVGRLRDGGLSDEAIHSVATVTGYFNFVNRIALGLGVELEAELQDRER